MAKLTKEARKEGDLLDELKARWAYGSAEWEPIRKQGAKDMRYLAGDCWDPNERRAREDMKRPVLNADELTQYVNQLINSIRQNKRGIKVAPESAEATDATATFRADLIRQIEYQSKAQMAYTTMFENAAQRGYGFLKITSQYVGETFDQELRIKPCMVPDLITPNPDGLITDGSDLDWLFEHQWITKKEFRRKYPKAKIQHFTGEQIKLAPTWFEGDRVQVAGYWTMELKIRRKLQFVTKNGLQESYLDELEQRPSPEFIRQERDVEIPTVMQYVTNGLEILKATPWAGPSIPFVTCYGKVMYLDRGEGMQRELLSLIRLARDPQMLYAYYRTQQAEMAGMIPKTPVVGYKGQFRGVAKDWSRSPHEPIAFLEANATIEDMPGVLLPLPQRMEYGAGEHLQALELCAEGARRAIQAAIGASPLPTQAQRRNEKSGVALQHMDDSAQRGSFHFVDHFDDAVMRTGTILEECIDFYYAGQPRTVITRAASGDAKPVRLNDSQPQQGRDGQPVPGMQTGQGKHNVTIAVGPKLDSEREAASDYADMLMASPMAPQVADLATKLKDLGPMGDEIAERLTPPQYKKPKPGQGPDPAQLMQKLQQQQQLLEMLTKELNAKNQVIEQEQVKSDLQIELQRMKDATSIRVAQIQASAKGLAVAQEDAATLDQLALEQAHEAGMSEMEHQQTLEQGQQAHDQALEQGGQGIAGQLAVGQQSADNQPEQTGAAE